jgi:hypothetical protein
MKLDDALAGVDRLGLDTPPFIYLIERNPAYIDAVFSVLLPAATFVVGGQRGSATAYAH